MRRRSRVYVPRAVVVANWAKAAVNSPAAWPWMRRFAAQVVPTLEREVEALGRHDQLLPSVGNPTAEITSSYHPPDPRHAARSRINRAAASCEAGTLTRIAHPTERFTPIGSRICLTGWSKSTNIFATQGDEAVHETPRLGSYHVRILLSDPARLDNRAPLCHGA